MGRVKESIKILCLVCIIGFSGCGKKENKQLAKNYYDLSSLELKEDTPAFYKRSLQYVEKALEQEEKPEYLARKATLLFKLGHHEECLQCFRQLLDKKIDPYMKSEVLNNYACALGQTGKQQEALQIFEKLEKSKEYLTPEVSMVNQGKIYSEAGENDRAQEKFSQATKVSNNYVDAHYYLAIVSSILDDQKQMEEEIQTTLFLEPEHKGAKSLWERPL